MWPVGLWQIGQASAAPLWSLLRSEPRALLHLQDRNPAGRPGDGADRANAKPTGHPDVIRRHQMHLFLLLTGTSFSIHPTGDKRDSPTLYFLCYAGHF